MSEQMKKCKHCQTDIPKKAKVCPNCKLKQTSKLKTGLIIAGVLFVIGIIGSSGDDESESTANVAQSTEVAKVSNDVKTETVKEVEVVKESETVEQADNVKETETVVEITYTVATVSEMIDMLESNALKAEKTYQDQYVEVTGRLGTIDSDGDYITLYPQDDEWSFIGVQCYIKNDEQMNKVLEMTVDDIVTVKGKIKTVGEVIGYGLDIDEIK